MANNEITIENLSPTSDLVAVAALYARVFAGFPWFEKSQGTKCRKFYDLEPDLPCPCGSETLQPAYPPQETANYILYEITKPLAIALLAIIQDLPVAFAWGYQMTSQEFANKKYNFLETQKKIQNIIPSETYFYISEVGVNPQNQGQGIGTLLTTKLMEQNSPPFLMRTLNTSPMAIIGNKLNFTTIIGPDLPNVDPENPNRIIYIKNDYNK